MRIIAKQMEISSDEGFAQDLFGRSTFGKALTNLTSQTSDGLVISLDAKWGEGKTTFVKMWQGMLKEKQIPSIYIDAFKDDYASDAFLNLSSHISDYAEDNIEKDEAKEFREKAAKILVNVLSWGAKVGAKAATLGLIGAAELDSLSDLKDEIASSGSELAEKLVREKLSSARADTALVHGFHQTLSALPAKLPNNPEKRLVIIVDELDRCRPTYAVDILERIKHLFSVPNITFVLVMNKEQLESALKSVYGENLDARTYLQKFVTVEVALPKKSDQRHRNESDLKIYAKKLYKAHELKLDRAEGAAIDCIALLAQTFDISLRQLERAFTNMAIIYSSIPERHYSPTLPICFLSVLKVIEPAIFNRLSASKISYKAMVEELQRKYPSFIIGNDDTQLTKTFYSIFNAFTSEHEYTTVSDNHGSRKYGGDLFNYNMERTDIAPYLFEKLGLLSSIE
jgi:tRNA A37 threonylcarbamoyladenosine biosynthesis protein TsaE